MILTICIGISFAAETDVNSSIIVKKVGDKYVSEEEYWVIRSQALTELIPFLTSIRREAKQHYKGLTDYIQQIGRGQNFLESGIKGPSSPAEYAKLTGIAEGFAKNNIVLPEKYMTWDQLAELAMEFVMNEGYDPTNVNGPEEIEMLKQICERKRKYGKKVQTDLSKITQDCMDMKAYLDSIDQFEACIKTIRYQKEQEEQAKREETRRRREDRTAVRRSKRETKQERREAIKEARREEAVDNRLSLERRKRFRHTYYRGAYRRYRY